MNTPPKPKFELVVERGKYSLVVHTASADATAFVMQHGPAYGSCIPLTNNQFILNIAPTFDLDEVAKYFESYRS